MKKLILLFALLPTLAFSQDAGVTHSGNILRPSAGQPGLVRICDKTASGEPCYPLVTMYSDSALSIPLTVDAQGWLATDANGNFENIWVAPGTYKEQTKVGTVYHTKFITVGGTGSGGGGLINHNLLSATHTDTVPASPPAMGDWIMGNSGGKWQSQSGNNTTTPKWMQSVGNGTAVTSQGFASAGGPCPDGQFSKGINADITPDCTPITFPSQTPSTPPAPFAIPTGQAVAWAFPTRCQTYQTNDPGGPYVIPATATTDVDMTCGSTGGVLRRYASGPLHSFYDYGMLWDQFTMPSLPGDAVIQHIYPVGIALRYGTSLDGFTLLACGGENLVPSTTHSFGGYFSNNSSMGSTSGTVTSASCNIDNGASTSGSGADDVNIVQLVALAIYYTTATPQTINSSSFFSFPYYPAINGISISFASMADGSPMTYSGGNNYISDQYVTLNHLTATRALNVTALQDGGDYFLEFIQDATGGAVVTAGTGCTWTNPDGSSYTFSNVNTAANGRSFIRWKYKAANTRCMVSATGTGSGMVYPGAGIPLSTGSAWGTSLPVPDGNAAHYLDGSGAWSTPAGSGGGNTTSTSLTTNTLPKANGANSIVDSKLSDDGTTLSYAGTGGMSFPGAFTDSGTKVAGTSCTVASGDDFAICVGSTNQFLCTLSAGLGGGSCLPTSGSGTINSGTAKQVGVYSGSTAISGYSGFQYDDSTHAVSVSGSVSAGTAGTASGEVDLTGVTSGNVVSLKAADSTSAATITVPGTANGTMTVSQGSITAGHCAKFATDGTGVVDAGAACITGGTLGISGFYLTDGAGAYYVGPLMFPATLPNAANYAWVNQVSATETATGGGLVLNSPANSGISIHARAQSISTNTTLTAAFVDGIGACGAGAGAGIGFRESATGKLITYGDTYGGTATAGGQWVSYWTSPTVFSSALLNEVSIATNSQAVKYLRLVYNGTTIAFSRSFDGVTWTQTFSEAKAAHFTTAPDQFIYWIDPESTKACYITLLSWKVE